MTRHRSQTHGRHLRTIGAVLTGALTFGIALPALADIDCHPPVIGWIEGGQEPIYDRSHDSITINYHDQCSGDAQTRVYVADAIEPDGWTLIKTDGAHAAGFRHATASGLSPGGEYCFEVEVEDLTGVTYRSERLCTHTSMTNQNLFGVLYDPFYDRMLSWRGIDVISSTAVGNAARFGAVDRLEIMIGGRADLRARLRDQGAYVGVMGLEEVTTDIPEHAMCGEVPCDDAARGLGGVIGNPITTVGAENVLNMSSQFDIYAGEDILIHEFGHTVYNLAAPDGLRAAVEACYDSSVIDDGLWANTYAATDVFEYWAEATQSWFDANQVVQTGIHNDIRTRSQLREYDRCIYDLLTYTYAEEHGRTVLDPDDPSDDLHLWQYDSGKLAATGGRDDSYYGAYIHEWNGSSWDIRWSGWSFGAEAFATDLEAQTFTPYVDLHVYRHVGGHSKSLRPAPGHEASGTTDRVGFAPAI